MKVITITQLNRYVKTLLEGDRNVAAADAHILAGVNAEGGPLNRAPRNSILAENLALQVLSVILQEKKNLSPQQYVLRHPGGSLGTLRENEK